MGPSAVIIRPVSAFGEVQVSGSGVLRVGLKMIGPPVGPWSGACVVLGQWVEDVCAGPRAGAGFASKVGWGSRSKEIGLIDSQGVLGGSA